MAAIVEKVFGMGYSIIGNDSLVAISLPIEET
jgi:hypothetical protein